MVKQGYKQTEIGLIPEDWEVDIFSNVSFMKGRIGWQGLKQTEFTFNDNEPFLITGMNFKEGKIRWGEVYHVSEERYEIAKDIQLRQTDVLMTKDGTIGKILFVDEIPYPYKATLNSHLLLFRPLKNKYISKYLYYNLQFKYFLDHIEENKTGTTFFGISQESVGKYQISLPPLSEQEAIAAALSDADAWIESLEQLIAKKRLIKQGAMQTLLTPKEDWEMKKLGDCLSYIQPTPFLVKSIEYNPNNDLPVLTAGKTFVLGYTDEDFGIFEKLPTIIFDDFTTACKYVDFPFKAKSSAMKMLVLRDNTNNLKFLFEIMQVLRFQVGDHKRHWIGEFQNLEIKVPSLSEQDRIATILSDMNAELETLENQLAKARQIKQGMMQELLTGRVRLV